MLKCSKVSSAYIMVLNFSTTTHQVVWLLGCKSGGALTTLVLLVHTQCEMHLPQEGREFDLMMRRAIFAYLSCGKAPTAPVSLFWLNPKTTDVVEKCRQLLFILLMNDCCLNKCCASTRDFLHMKSPVMKSPHRKVRETNSQILPFKESRWAFLPAS